MIYLSFGCYNQMPPPICFWPKQHITQHWQWQHYRFTLHRMRCLHHINPHYAVCAPLFVGARRLYINIRRLLLFAFNPFVPHVVCCFSLFFCLLLNRFMHPWTTSEARERRETTTWIARRCLAMSSRFQHINPNQAKHIYKHTHSIHSECLAKHATHNVSNCTLILLDTRVFGQLYADTRARCGRHPVLRVPRNSRTFGSTHKTSPAAHIATSN